MVRLLPGILNIFLLFLSNCSFYLYLTPGHTWHLVWSSGSNLSCNYLFSTHHWWSAFNGPGQCFGFRHLLQKLKCGWQPFAHCPPAKPRTVQSFDLRLSLGPYMMRYIKCKDIFNDKASHLLQQFGWLFSNSPHLTLNLYSLIIHHSEGKLIHRCNREALNISIQFPASTILKTLPF